MTLIKFSKTGSPRTIDGSRCDLFESLMGRTFSGFTSGHPCIGARTTNADETQYAAVFKDMHSVETAFEVINDWKQYLALTDHIPLIKTCALIFQEPITTQEEFAERFWSFAQTLHDVDCQFHDWDQSIGTSVDSSDFEYCLAGRAVFTTTLNPQNPRYARKFAYPVWVMNQIKQFEHLRSEGRFSNWQTKIRKTDSEFDPSGTYNHILEDHGEASAASQLAGSKYDNLSFEVRVTKADKKSAKDRIFKKAEIEQCPPDIIEAIMSSKLADD